MRSAVQLQRLPSVHVAAVRGVVGPEALAGAVRDGWRVAQEAVEAQHLTPGRRVAIYWNDAVRLEAGVEVTGGFEERDGLVRTATPAGLTAFATHFGPYETLGETHDAIVAWCAEHKRRIAGPRWEVYGQWEPEWTEHPERIRTDVFYHVVSTEVFTRPTPT